MSDRDHPWLINKKDKTHLEAEQDEMRVAVVHSGRHIQLYGTDVFNRWDALEIAILERRRENSKVGWKSEKSCHTGFGRRSRIQEK